MRRNLFVFFRVFEVVRTAVGRIETRQVEVAAALARRFSIALDLASLALVTAPKCQQSSVYPTVTASFDRQPAGEKGFNTESQRVPSVGLPGNRNVLDHDVS